MKKILFIITNFRQGGTNRSLENLLSLIDLKIYHPDVFALDHFGPYKNTFSNCTILPENIFLKAFISNFNDLNLSTKIISLFLKSLRNICSLFNINFSHYLYSIIGNKILKFEDYDTLISYSEGIPTHFVYKINHNNKIAWIHCDYSSYMKLNNYPNENTVYNTFKKIICVSNYTKKVFLDIMPSLSNRCEYVYNLLNTTKIIEQSNEIITDNMFKNECFTIITIGSFYPIKRLAYIPNIAKGLVKRNNTFKWYIIANVNNIDEFLIFRQQIIDENLSTNVIFLGEKVNPYPFLKRANLFVTLSITEACPYVVNESRVLHIPIVSSDFPSASEFIDDRKTGYIASIDKIEETIDLVINNKNIYSELILNNRNFNYNNEDSLYKLYTII